MALQHELRHTHFIYCLDQQADGSYVFLNRNYKPVGFIDVSFTNYDEYPVAVHIKGLTAAKAEKISYKSDPSTNRIYLYNDGCVPTDSAKYMTEYLKRLGVIASLKIDGKKHKG